MVNVAIGVIKHPLISDAFLMTVRAEGSSHAGYWEFPGGKIEEGEPPMAALSRELFEELGITVLDAQLLGLCRHDYNTYSVNLHVYHVRQYQGDARCLVGQKALRWMTREDLKTETVLETVWECLALALQ